MIYFFTDASWFHRYLFRTTDNSTREHRFWKQNVSAVFKPFGFRTEVQYRQSPPHTRAFRRLRKSRNVHAAILLLHNDALFTCKRRLYARPAMSSPKLSDRKPSGRKQSFSHQRLSNEDIYQQDESHDTPVSWEWLEHNLIYLPTTPNTLHNNNIIYQNVLPVLLY